MTPYRRAGQADRILPLHWRQPGGQPGVNNLAQARRNPVFQVYQKGICCYSAIYCGEEGCRQGVRKRVRKGLFYFRSQDQGRTTVNEQNRHTRILACGNSLSFRAGGVLQQKFKDLLAGRRVFLYGSRAHRLQIILRQNVCGLA